ncbi:AEG_G0025990.mRNA.1.CDS.1 [Saccharomyces cerevisiae]|nr:AEG_G0025990.mRNA.1.CDS.1 [Saccharomyces cerevisiae]CAI6728233.1 AEG_G0025990.mRNA.1.CDS.1 [Saccharomyces cerevisiae]
MDRKRSFEKIVISVMVGKNVQKFLTFVEDEPDFQGGPIPSNATTTESTDSNTSATTTASTNSSTNATTTASTNSSTNATTTESTNASAKEDANKDGNAEDNRFHPVTDINKESYKRKGSQMVLLERKKLKAQFPNTSENMNVLQFLGFRSDEIKHLSSMVLTYTSAQREYSHNTDYARAVKRCSSSVSVGLARKYRIGGWLGKH